MKKINLLFLCVPVLISKVCYASGNYPINITPFIQSNEFTYRTTSTVQVSTAETYGVIIGRSPRLIPQDVSLLYNILQQDGYLARERDFYAVPVAGETVENYQLMDEMLSNIQNTQIHRNGIYIFVERNSESNSVTFGIIRNLNVERVTAEDRTTERYFRTVENMIGGGSIDVMRGINNVLEPTRQCLERIRHPEQQEEEFVETIENFFLFDFSRVFNTLSHIFRSLFR